MKRIFRLFFIMILTMSLGIVYAEDVTIDKVVEAFNTGEVVEEYKSYGGSVVATYDDDSIDVVAILEGQTYNISYNLNGTIITANIDSNSENSFLEAIIFLGIIDDIGELYGYGNGELSKTVNSEQVSEYTLAEEGFEMTKVSETVQEIKIDYSKKVPLIDFSGVYVEVKDLEKYKEYIADDGQAGTTKGNIYIYKFGYNGEYEILVGEKDEVTEASYKSILSMIEVMFDGRAVKYFKDNYPSISEDKSFDGFEIKVNYSDPEDNDVTYLEDNGYRVIKIFVNKELVLEKIKDIEMPTGSDNEDATSDDEKVDNEEKEEAPIVKKENTIQTILKNYGLYIGIGAGVLVLLIIIIAVAGKKKKTVTAVENYETINISMSDMGKVIRPAVFNDNAPVQSTNPPMGQQMQQPVQQPQMQQPMNNGMQQGQMPMNNMAMNQQQMQMQQAMMQQQAMAQQQMNQGQQMNNMQNQNMNGYQNNYNGNNNYNGQ